MTPSEARTWILEHKSDRIGVSGRIPFEGLNEAFRVYWASGPSREDFELVMDLCPLSGVMLWDMVRSDFD